MKDLWNKFKELDKLEFIKQNDPLIAVTMLSFSGFLCIGMGIMLPFVPTSQVSKQVVVTVNQGLVSEQETQKEEIILKEMSSEVNQPISVNVEDYLEKKVSIKILSKLKLDTSEVNIGEPGTYKYTVKYKKKTYTGVYKITEKQLPTVETMTLKELRLTVGSELPQNVEAYITEKLAPEVIANLKIDLSNVNVNKAGDYQYTVTYDGKLYTGKIIIYEPQPTIVKPSQEKKEEETPKTCPSDQVLDSNNQCVPKFSGEQEIPVP